MDQEKATDKDGERIEKEWDKLTDTEKLKCEFCESIGQSEAEAEAMLLARVASATEDDWKAAMQILQRMFAARWASKEYLHVEGRNRNQARPPQRVRR